VLQQALCAIVNCPEIHPPISRLTDDGTPQNGNPATHQYPSKGNPLRPCHDQLPSQHRRLLGIEANTKRGIMAIIKLWFKKGKMQGN
jgi:hypothetical protein